MAELCDIRTNSETEQEIGNEEFKSEGELGSCVVLKKTLPLVSQFSQLQQNADLNRPPPNWLKRASQAGYYFQQPLFSRFDHTPTSPERYPSSIQLASHYPERVGDIDVISDAKNVKKLLMLPYRQSVVSMAIHKVGKTLLIDELVPSMFTLRSSSLTKLSSVGKIPKLLAHKKDPASSRHRNMYSKLLYYSIQDQQTQPMLPSSEDIEISQLPPSLTDPNSDLSHLPTVSPITEGISGKKVEEEEKELKKDFDYHTSVSPTLLSLELSSRKQEMVIGREEESNISSEPVMEPEKEEIAAHFPCLPPDPPPQPFHHNVEWTIKDIRMLLGSDLPIFGKGGHPAISLKLRDMQKPITVLTGLDYWLDNLMCNVPELVMCFHVNGIVQKYEIIKTEDIPKLDKNSQFSPKEIQEVAQNILSFLKANCTKEGHTYWLFRPKGEDVVKLYDLTSLTSSETHEDEDDINPFATNVALLLYRVSQRMLRHTPHTPEELAIIKLLLENCIKLLKEDINSQIVISSYYLLADLILTHTPINTSRHNFPHDSLVEDQEGMTKYREGMKEKPKDKVKEKELKDEKMKRRKKDFDKKQESKVTSETQEEADVHQKYDSSIKNFKDSPSLSVSDLRESCVSPEPVSSPPVKPLVLGSRQERARIALSYITKGLSIGETKEGRKEWKLKAMSQMIQLASQTYWILAEMAMELTKLGRTLRYLRHCILCNKASLCCSKTVELLPKDDNNILYQAWLLAGDVHCLSTKVSGGFSSHLEEFQFVNPDDYHVLNVASSIYNPSATEDTCLTLHTDIETSLIKSIDCYKQCQKLLDEKDHTGKRVGQRKSGEGGKEKNILTERLGNVWNELGVYYKHLSSTLEFGEDPKEVEKLWSDSYHCLSNGLSLFEITNNTSNQALLYANLGSLMRLCAIAYGTLHHPMNSHEEMDSEVEEERHQHEFSSQEKLYYNRAIGYYIKGKEVLHRASTDRSIWYNLECDLASVYYTMGQQLQERPPLSTLTVSEVEKEILSYLMKSLHHAESALSTTNTRGLKFVSLSQCMGDSHYRLASLYQKTASSSSATSQKLKVSQAGKHYIKALQYYSLPHHRIQIVRIYLEMALLHEQEATGVGKQSIHLLHSSLENLLRISEVLKHYEEERNLQEKERQNRTDVKKKGVVDHNDTERDEGKRKDEYEEESFAGKHEDLSVLNQLLGALIQRLQTVLKQLLTISMKKSEFSKTSQQTYKQMYTIALKCDLSSCNSSDLTNLNKSLLTISYMYHDLISH